MAKYKKPSINVDYVDAGPGSESKKTGNGVDVEATHTAKTPYTGDTYPGKPGSKAEKGTINAGPGDPEKRPGTGK